MCHTEVEPRVRQEPNNRSNTMTLTQIIKEQAQHNIKEYLTNFDYDNTKAILKRDTITELYQMVEFAFNITLPTQKNVLGVRIELGELGIMPKMPNRD
jgi:hypothetical protein